MFITWIHLHRFIYLAWKHVYQPSSTVNIENKPPPEKGYVYFYGRKMHLSCNTISIFPSTNTTSYYRLSTPGAKARGVCFPFTRTLRCFVFLRFSHLVYSVKHSLSLSHTHTWTHTKHGSLLQGQRCCSGSETYWRILQLEDTWGYQTHDLPALIASLVTGLVADDFS